MSTKQTGDDAETGWTDSGINLLRRGWSVGKNLALAGAAITAAPVVVPPLLVFSAFGLALSVPFSIYYAGVVGTERLMGSLLPLNQDQNQMSNEDEERNEDMVGLLRDESEITEDRGERDEDDVIVETVKLTEQEDDEITSVPVEKAAMQKTITETVIDVNDGPNEGVITTKQMEIKPIKVESKERTKKTENQEAQEEQKKVIIVDSVPSNESDEAKGENGSRGFSSELPSTELDRKSGVGSNVTSAEEERYNKKQLWEQVRALRIIVGYKEPIGKKLPDEMRALYEFTGVELPLTARDASNLVDLNYKLQFLKSVVGVK